MSGRLTEPAERRLLYRLPLEIAAGYPARRRDGCDCMPLT
jgi:hypothetical protein